MTIRFNPDLYSNVLSGLNINNQQEEQILTELSSGKSVNAPSDNPAAYATEMNLQFQSSQDDQFTQNISSVQGQLQTADSAMSSLNTALTQAISLGTEAGNTSLSTADRTAISNQIQSISQQVLSLANTTYQGSYIFAGTASNAPAYSASATSASGVIYNGNNATNQVEISPGEKIGTNLPGSQIFTSSGSDVFEALTNLSQAAQSGTGVAAALSQLQTAFSHVSSQGTFYGAALSQLETTQNVLAADQVNLSSQENTVVGADIASVASQLSQVETARQALLEAGGKIPNTNLFNYIQA